MRLRGVASAVAAVVLIVIGCGAAARNQPSGPSMMLNDGVIARLKSAAKTDNDTNRRLQQLRASADAILDQPLIAARLRQTGSGEPLTVLFAARELLQRMTELGLAWNLWGDERYAIHGRKELLGVAALGDWKPEKFLATAEMSAAVAIGLDWFTNHLADTDKEIIVRALIKLGIEPGLQYYEGNGGDSRGSWVRPRKRDESATPATEKADHDWEANSFNWNMVCNGGMALAALAIRSTHRDLSDRLLEHSVKSIAFGFAEYGDDGGFAEGPEYWSLATRYAVSFLSAAKDILGQDFGFGRTPGFGKTGDFILHLTGPTGLAFNFGDSDTDPNRTALSWLSQRYDRPVDAWFARHRSPGSRLALSLVWRVSDDGKDPVLAGVHPDHWFRSVGVATFRSAWLEPMAVFAGLKGGDSGGHHTHLDLGTFVIDGLGQRWAIELGRGNYALPGYFGDKRWTYYRTSTAGQNTLMFDGENQIPGAVAPVTAFRRSPGLSFAITDLGSAYGVAAQSIRRGLALIGGRTILVQDEIGGDKPASVRWGMHTHSQVSVSAQDPATLTLRQGGQTLGARILSPPGTRFSVVSASQPPPQNSNEGVVKVVIDLPAVTAGTRRRIAVLLEPGADRPPDAIDLVPLTAWDGGWRPGGD